MKAKSIFQEETCDVNDKSCCSGSRTSTETDMKSHWSTAYESSIQNKLGWFEENPEPSLNLLNRCNLDKTSVILNVGAGTTTFVDELLKKGFENIIVNDISPVALDKLKMRLGKEHLKHVRWVPDDLTKPKELETLEPINLWHDRAVLHFFQNQNEQDTYFNLLKKLVRLNGYVIIAAFNLNGAKKCSGLPVFRYDAKMLEKKLGRGFILMETFDFTYKMPSGDPREYVYTLFKRIENQPENI